MRYFIKYLCYLSRLKIYEICRKTTVPESLVLNKVTGLCHATLLKKDPDAGVFWWDFVDI